MLTEEELNLNIHFNVKKLKDFLSIHSLSLDNIDTCYCIFDDENIIACGCKEKNVLKCFAVNEEYRSFGIFDNIVSKLVSKCYTEGESLIFCFTKLENKAFFTSQNFTSLASGKKSVLLYRGNKSIIETLHLLKNDFTLDLSKSKNGAVVINANPFTLGHKHLINMASKEVEKLFIFVVQEDKSFFSFNERFLLVKEGVKEFPNIIVLPSTPFLISRATFPSYFLKETTSINIEHALIDAKVFGSFFVPEFNISLRFLGEEPFDANTKLYNEILLSELNKYSCNVKIIDRLKTDSGKIISASTVRELFLEKRIEEIRDFVPISTYNLLEKKLK